MTADLGICDHAGPCSVMRLALADGWRAVLASSTHWLFMSHRNRPLDDCPWCGRPVSPSRTARWPWAALVSAPTEAQADGAP